MVSRKVRLLCSVAVCVPTFDRERCLERLIEDLMYQTVCPGVLVVVDGNPGSGAVKGLLRELSLPERMKVVYVPSNHANLAYQRYVGWLAARRERVKVILYLDDDLQIGQKDAVEKVLEPLLRESEVVGVTGRIEREIAASVERVEPVLRDVAEPPGGLWAFLVARLGSKTPPGGLTPFGDRHVPKEATAEYAPVEWLSGGVMAYRMEALSQACFSEELFAMTHLGIAKGEDTLLSRRVGARGKLLMACKTRFLHPTDVVPNAYPVKPFRLGYAKAYSRRLLNDNYRYPGPPTWWDRAGLARGYLGNLLICWWRALLRPASFRLSYALGYTIGALRGLVAAPNASKLTPQINWWADGDEALQRAVILLGS